MNKTEDSGTTFLGSGCANCGAPVMAALNPFYGVDLAVHKYVRNCGECAWYEFASEAGSSAPEVWASARPHGLAGFWTRLNAAISVLKAA